jgi:hypothetical protein
MLKGTQPQGKKENTKIFKVIISLMQLDGRGYGSSDWSVLDDQFTFKSEAKVKLSLC